MSCSTGRDHVQCYRCHEYCYHCGQWGPWGEPGWRALDDPPLLQHGVVLDQAAASQESGWETLNVKVIRFKHRDIATAARFLRDHLQRAYLPDKIDGETELVLTLVTRKAWPALE